MKCSRLAPVLLSLVFFVLVGTASRAGAVGIWHRDYPTARAEARAEGKGLLIVFTGTDWIEICEKFYDDILGQPAFIEAVSGEFALLKLEFPKDNRLPREEALQKALLRDAYRVRGFPTVVLTDANGRPFGLNGYQPVSAEEYAEQLLDIAKAHGENLAAAQAAESLSGKEKAEGLRRAIPDVPDALIARFYRAEMEAVLAADPGDALRLAGPFRKLIAEADFEQEIQVLGREGKWAEAIARTDRHIAELGLEGWVLQAALIYRAGFELRAGQAETSAATLRKVVAMDPESEPGMEAARLLEEGKKEGGETAPEPAPLRAQPVP